MNALCFGKRAKRAAHIHTHTHAREYDNVIERIVIVVMSSSTQTTDGVTKLNNGRIKHTMFPYAEKKNHQPRCGRISLPKVDCASRNKTMLVRREM